MKHQKSVWVICVVMLSSITYFSEVGDQSVGKYSDELPRSKPTSELSIGRLERDGQPIELTSDKAVKMGGVDSDSVTHEVLSRIAYGAPDLDLQSVVQAGLAFDAAEIDKLSALEVLSRCGYKISDPRSTIPAPPRSDTGLSPSEARRMLEERCAPLRALGADMLRKSERDLVEWRSHSMGEFGFGYLPISRQDQSSKDRENAVRLLNIQVEKYGADILFWMPEGISDILAFSEVIEGLPNHFKDVVVIYAYQAVLLARCDHFAKSCEPSSWAYQSICAEIGQCGESLRDSILQAIPREVQPAVRDLSKYILVRFARHQPLDARFISYTATQ